MVTELYSRRHGNICLREMCSGEVAGDLIACKAEYADSVLQEGAEKAKRARVYATPCIAARRKCNPYENFI